MHSTLLDLIFGVIGASFVVYGAMLLAAIWFVPSLKRQVLLHPWLWGRLPHGNFPASTQALFYLLFGAYFTCGNLGYRVLSYSLFVLFAICAVVMFGQRFNHRSGHGRAKTR